MLASAMMTGYFLRQMEQRKELEENLFADDERRSNQTTSSISKHRMSGNHS